MPEGHTLFRLARTLDTHFAGRTVAVSSPQGRFAAAASLLDGSRLESAESYGKHLFVDFEEDRCVHVHLGLYGKFAVRSGEAPPPVGQVRLRLVAAADPDREASYGDLRGATACELMIGEERAMLLDRLGPDPLRADADPDVARARIQRSRTAVGALLMDQSVLSGIGNVYRAEALFRARIDPYRPGTGIGDEDWALMWTDLVAMLRAGVRAGRIVTTAPADRERRTGRARQEDAHYVYRRTGLPCRICGTPVRTAEMVSRNLYWCPVCQAV